MVKIENGHYPGTVLPSTAGGATLSWMLSSTFTEKLCLLCLLKLLCYMYASMCNDMHITVNILHNNNNIDDMHNNDACFYAYYYEYHYACYYAYYYA